MSRTRIIAFAAAALVASCGGEGSRERTCANSGCLVVTATDPSGAPLPCKVTVSGMDGAPTPAWGQDLGHTETGQWAGDGTVRVRNTVLSNGCDGIEAPLPPGRYRVTVSRGITHAAPQLDVAVTDPNWREERVVVLEKAEAFADWRCGDLHVHSAPSFDSDVPIDQRLVSAVAEGLDVLVPADHDAVGEWQPNDDLLRDGDLLVIRGLEITPDTWDVPVEGAHLNVFPLPPDRHPSDFRIASDSIQSLIDHARSLTGTSLLQLNHPRFASWNGLFTTLGLMPSSLDPALVDQLPFDAIEVYNGHELDANVQGDVSDVMQDWFALLNVGWPAVATGSSDTHRLSGSPVGLPRTCVASTADDPESFIDTLRAGHAFVTNGPALDVAVDGVAPGGLVQPAEPHVQVDVQVAAADWIHVDTVEVWVDGTRVDAGSPPANGPFSATVPVQEDAWVLAVVRGATPLGPPAGIYAERMSPLAFSNPVFIDADGDGLWVP